MEYYLFVQDNTEYNIASIVSLIIIVLSFLLSVFFIIRVITKKRKVETEKTGRAKILFKSVSEYDKTNFTNLTTYHKRNLFIDCLIDGEKKTLLCSEYMYNYVQKGETYDVVYTSDHIELDRKYYPDDFDDYFVDGSDDYDNDDDDYDDYESEE